MFVYIYINVHIYIYIHMTIYNICVCICMCICMCTCIYVHICAYMCTYVLCMYCVCIVYVLCMYVNPCFYWYRIGPFPGLGLRGSLRLHEAALMKGFLVARVTQLPGDGMMRPWDGMGEGYCNVQCCGCF